MTKENVRDVFIAILFIGLVYLNGTQNKEINDLTYRVNELSGKTNEQDEARFNVLFDNFDLAQEKFDEVNARIDKLIDMQDIIIKNVDERFKIVAEYL